MTTIKVYECFAEKNLQKQSKNKMCLWNTNAPDNVAKITIKDTYKLRSCHKKCSCAIYKL